MGPGKYLGNASGTDMFVLSNRVSLPAVLATVGSGFRVYVVGFGFRAWGVGFRRPQPALLSRGPGQDQP